MEICHQALRALESGHNYQDVAEYFLLPESKISQWHQRAQALAELKSRNGNSRIIPLQRAPAFMPAPLHDRADRAIFVQLTERMHQHQLGPKLTEVAKLVLLGSNATHSRISLKTMVDLNKFLFDFSFCKAGALKISSGKFFGAFLYVFQRFQHMTKKPAKKSVPPTALIQ